MKKNGIFMAGISCWRSVMLLAMEDRMIGFGGRQDNHPAENRLRASPGHRLDSIYERLLLQRDREAGRRKDELSVGPGGALGRQRSQVGGGTVFRRDRNSGHGRHPGPLYADQAVSSQLPIQYSLFYGRPAAGRPGEQPRSTRNFRRCPMSSKNTIRSFLGSTGVGDYNLYTTFPVKSIADVKGRKIAAAGANLPWISGRGSRSRSRAASTRPIRACRRGFTRAGC